MIQPRDGKECSVRGNDWIVHVWMYGSEAVCSTRSFTHLMVQAPAVRDFPLTYDFHRFEFMQRKEGTDR